MIQLGEIPHKLSKVVTHTTKRGDTKIEEEGSAERNNVNNELKRWRNINFNRPDTIILNYNGKENCL